MSGSDISPIYLQFIANDEVSPKIGKIQKNLVGFEKDVEKTQKSLSSLSKVSGGYSPAFAKAMGKAGMDMLNASKAAEQFTTSLNKAKNVSSSLSREVGKLSQKINGINFKNVNGRFDDLLSRLNLIRQSAYTAGTWIVGPIKGLLNTTGEFEKMNQLLKGLSTSSDELGRSLDASIDQDFIIKLAKSAPFEIKAIQDAFVKFRTGGLDPTQGSLQALIDSVAAFGGSSDEIHRASIAIQQMYGKGTISMEELRQQLGEAIPDAMRALAKVYSDGDMAKLAKDISKGMLQATDWIPKMMEELGRQHKDAAKNMMGTWSGMVSQMKTEWDLFQKKIGESGFMDDAKKIVEDIKKALADPSTVKTVGRIGDMLSTVAGGFGSVINLAFEFKDILVDIGTTLLLFKGMSMLKNGIESFNKSQKEASENSIFSKYKEERNFQIAEIQRKRRQEKIDEAKNELESATATREAAQQEADSANQRKEAIQKDIEARKQKIESLKGEIDSEKAGIEQKKTLISEERKRVQEELNLIEQQIREKRQAAVGLRMVSKENYEAKSKEIENDIAQLQQEYAKKLTVIQEGERKLAEARNGGTSLAVGGGTSAKSKISVEKTALSNLGDVASSATAIESAKQQASAIQGVIVQKRALKEAISQTTQATIEETKAQENSTKALVENGEKLIETSNRVVDSTYSEIDASNKKIEVKQREIEFQQKLIDGNVKEAESEGLTAEQSLRDAEAKEKEAQSKLQAAEATEAHTIAVTKEDQALASANAQSKLTQEYIGGLTGMLKDATIGVMKMTAQLALMEVGFKAVSFAAETFNDVLNETINYENWLANAVSNANRGLTTQIQLMKMQSYIERLTHVANNDGVGGHVTEEESAAARKKLAQLTPIVEKAEVDLYGKDTRQQFRVALSDAERGYRADKESGNVKGALTGINERIEGTKKNLESLTKQYKTASGVVKEKLGIDIINQTDYLSSLERIKDSGNKSNSGKGSNGKGGTGGKKKSGGGQKRDYVNEFIESLKGNNAKLAVENEAMMSNVDETETIFKKAEAIVRGKLGKKTNQTAIDLEVEALKLEAANKLLKSSTDAVAKAKEEEHIADLELAGGLDNVSSGVASLMKAFAKEERELGYVGQKEREAILRNRQIAIETQRRADALKDLKKANEALYKTRVSALFDTQDRRNAEYEKEIRDIKAKYAYAVEGTDDYKAKLQMLQEAEERFALQNETSIQKLSRNWKDITGEMEEATKGWASSVASNIQTMLEGGSVSWRSFLTGMLSDVNKIIIQRIMADTINPLIDGIGAGISGGIKNIFGGSQTVSVEQVSQSANIVALDANTTALYALTASISTNSATDTISKMTGGATDYASLGVIVPGIEGLSLGVDTVTKDITAMAGATGLATEAVSTAGTVTGATTLATELMGTAQETTSTTASIALTELATTAQLASQAMMQMASQQGTATVTSMIGFANGGVMTSSGSVPLKAYASGGIANSAQLALFGEGSKPEAFVPLPDGRSIPVTLTGGQNVGGNYTPVSIQINVENNGQTSSSSGSGNDGQNKMWSELANKIKGMVVEEINTQKRPGGVLY